LNNQALINNTIGGIYKNLGDLTMASTYYEYAQQGFIKNGNRGNLSMVLSNIAYIQHKHGLHETALQTLAEAREHARAAGYVRIDSIIALAFGEVCRDTEEFELSIQSYQEAISLARESQENSAVAYAKAGLGETYRLMGETDQAVFYTREALLYAQNDRQSYEEALFQVQLGALYVSQGRTEDAISFLKTAYDALQIIGDQDAQARACFAAACAFFVQENYRKVVLWLNLMLGHLDVLGYDDFVVAEASRNPLLVQYAASKEVGGQYFKKLVQRIKARKKRLARKPAGAQSAHLTRVRCFGLNQSCIVLDGSEISEGKWRSNRARELFFYILSNPGSTSEQIASKLWPDLSPAKSASNFHINLFRARHATSPGIILQTNGRYHINPEVDLWYDVEVFEREYTNAAKLPSGQKIKELEAVSELYLGPFMPGFDNEWTADKRHQLENKFQKAVLEIIGFYSKMGDMEKVASVVEKALEINRDQEEAYYEGIQAYLALGQSLLAQHLYKRYMANIRELDAEPEPRITGLVRGLSFN
jgi:two-component SAPR family response regulator/Flp pilus assembly protein TadD